MKASELPKAVTRFWPFAPASYFWLFSFMSMVWLSWSYFGLLKDHAPETIMNACKAHKSNPYKYCTYIA